MALITEEARFFDKLKTRHAAEKGGPMKILLRIALAVVLLLAGFAAGFPIGLSRGFSTGSEWAFVQGNILAREAGLYMPVNYETGQFRIILKQPKHLYRNAWMLADMHEDDMTYLRRGDKTVNERREPARNASLPR